MERVCAAAGSHRAGRVKARPLPRTGHADRNPFGGLPKKYYNF